MTGGRTDHPCRTGRRFASGGGVNSGGACCRPTFGTLTERPVELFEARLGPVAQQIEFETVAILVAN